MKFILPTSLFIGVLLISCGSDSLENDSADHIETIDTSTVIDSIVEEIIELPVDPNRYETDVEALFAKASETFELPLKIDSTFLREYAQLGEDAEYNLTYEEAKHLGYSFAEGNLSNSNVWRVTNFIMIDSLKNVGMYEDYVSGLDIGQTKYSSGNVFGTVNVSNQTSILLWMVDYSTFEACPYGEGIYIFGTVFTNFVATQTTLLAEESGGGDPPAWGEDYTESEITDSTITIYRLEVWGEEDYESGEEYTEQREMHEVLGLSAYGLTVLEKDNYDY